MLVTHNSALKTIYQVNSIWATLNCVRLLKKCMNSVRRNVKRKIKTVIVAEMISTADARTTDLTGLTDLTDQTDQTDLTDVIGQYKDETGAATGIETGMTEIIIVIEDVS